MNIYEPKPHLLAFIDALGFSELIKSNKSEPVEKFLATIERTKTDWEQLLGKGEIQIQLIGDSIIFAIPAPGRLEAGRLLTTDKDFDKKLCNLSYGIGEIQIDLGLQDIWTRVAVVYDELLSPRGRNLILGKAFYRAHQLESKVAKYPRVIVDGGIAGARGHATSRKLVETTNAVCEKTSPLFDYTPGSVRILGFEQDVPTFVDFLNVPSSSSMSHWAAVERIGALISKRLKDEVSHYHKYKWLADYVIQHIERQPGHIPGELVRTLNLLREG